jgi:hypothetical protein
MDIIEIPEVMQLPELSESAEIPAAFADMALTTFLRFWRGHHERHQNCPIEL